MKRSTYIRSLFVAFFFCCLDSLYAKVYTIDFNCGTIGGGYSGYSALPSDNAAAFCSSGEGNLSAYSKDDSYYISKGCGIRIGKASGSGQAYFIATLSQEIQSKYIVKVVIYASKGTQNSDASIKIYAGTNTVTEEISFADMQNYNSSYQESSNYRLSDVILEKKFKNLKIQTQNPNYVMLHRIDIYTAESTSLSLRAQSGGTNYATFSCDTVTFFPNSATVSKVSVNDGRLNVSALDVEDGFGTSGCYVPANTGVLVASTNSSVVYYSLDGETRDALEGNMLKPESEDMEGDFLFYKLAYDDYANKTGLGFYWGAAGGGSFSCKDGTAYLAVPNGGSSSVKGFVLDEVSDEDAIKNLDADCPSKREYIYNVAGQRIGAPSQGFYIKDGRKFVGK